ncbi:hypothetical protein D5086_006275 [Populus alba]|uniref:Uncharacterized protein n=2 Tax=Populus alba TaxID=43335 RepID=A0ACC4CL61_POPAL
MTPQTSQQLPLNMLPDLLPPTFPDRLWEWNQMPEANRDFNNPFKLRIDLYEGEVIEFKFAYGNIHVLLWYTYASTWLQLELDGDLNIPIHRPVFILEWAPPELGEQQLFRKRI